MRAGYKTVFDVATVAVCAILAGPMTMSAVAANDATIKVGQPGEVGKLTVKVRCKREDNTVEFIQVTVQIPTDPDQDFDEYTDWDKARDIRDALLSMNPDCFNVTSSGEEVRIDPKDDNRIIEVAIENDSTRQTIGARVKSAEQVEGRSSIDGIPEGGMVSIWIDDLVAEIPSDDQSPEQIMLALVGQLQSQGVSAAFINGEIVVTDNLAGLEFGIFADDPGLIQNLTVFVAPPPIPTVSEWGLIILFLLLLTAGTIVIRRCMRQSQDANDMIQPSNA